VFARERRLFARGIGDRTWLRLDSTRKIGFIQERYPVYIRRREDSIVPHWRDELIEATKSKAEREAEEQERHRKRVEEALTTAEAAMKLAVDALRFVKDSLTDKGQPAEFTDEPDACRLSLREFSLGLELARDSAVLRVIYADGKPREFDFAKDRHISPVDVEEYVGRRSVEMVRAAQKAASW
jgi:hypothetical protein